MGRAGQGRAGRGGPVDDNVWFIRQMGQGENEGKNMEKGRRKGQHNREG